MPLRKIEDEEQQEITRRHLEENGASEELAKYVVNLGASVDRALRKTFRGMVVGGTIMVLAIVIGWFAFTEVVDDIQDGRVENVKRGCVRDQKSNNVVLAIIDFSLDPANRQRGDPPPNKERIEQFLKLIEPLRPESTLAECNETLARIGTDERMKINELLPLAELKRRQQEKEKKQRKQSSGTDLQVPEDGRPQRGAINGGQRADRGQNGGQNGGEVTRPPTGGEEPEHIPPQTTPDRPQGKPGPKGDEGDKGDPGQDAPPAEPPAEEPPAEEPQGENAGILQPVLEGALKGLKNATCAVLGICPP